MAEAFVVAGAFTVAEVSAVAGATTAVGAFMAEVFMAGRRPEGRAVLAGGGLARAVITAVAAAWVSCLPLFCWSFFA